MDKLHQAEDARSQISKRILYIVSLNHLINDSSTYLIASLFPAIVLAFSFSEFEIGILVAIGYVINMIFQPLTGRLSERYEERKLLALGISFMAVSMLLFTISTSFVMMLVSVLILRFGSSFYHPVGVAAISRNYRGRTLDSSMGFQSSFGNLGVMLAFALSAPLYLILGWRGPFLIYATLQTVIVATTLIGMRKERAPIERPSDLDAQKTTESVATNHNSSRENLSTSVGSGSSRYLLLGLPLFFFFAALVSGGAYSIISNFGNLFLVHNGFGFTNSDYLIALWVASAFFGAIISGWLTRKLGREKLLLIVYSFGGLATFGFAFSYHDILLVILSLIVSGFSISVTYPAIYSELSAYLERNPKLTRGTAYGVLFTGQITGSAIFGVVTGYLADALSLRVPFIIGASMLVFYAATVFVRSRS